MPELPEVETIVSRLRQLVVGKTIKEIKVDRQKSFQGDPSSLIGQKIIHLTRRAKIIQFDLEDDRHLLVHLKMTGQLIYVEPGTRLGSDSNPGGDSKPSDGLRVGGGHPSADWIQKLPSKHTRVIITFTDNTTLFFNDQRVFGWIKLLTPAQLQQEFFKLAPDINDPTLDHHYFYDKIKNRKLKIKQLIMDNTVVAGVGNIYACDALNLARINPEKPAHLLSRTDCKNLFNAMQTVIELGIKLGGATISDFAHVDGFAGQYQNQAKVYGRLGQNCYNCNTQIQKKKVAGRGTYFCPNCQI